MLITELSSHSWTMDIYSMREHSDSMSEHYCLIILKKKKIQEGASKCRTGSNTSTLWA